MEAWEINNCKDSRRRLIEICLDEMLLTSMARHLLTDRIVKIPNNNSNNTFYQTKLNDPDTKTPVESIVCKVMSTKKVVDTFGLVGQVEHVLKQ